FEACQGLVELAEFPAGVAEKPVRGGPRGRQADRLFQEADRILEPAFLKRDRAEQIDRVRIGAIVFEHPQVTIPSLGQCALPMQAEAFAQQIGDHRWRHEVRSRGECVEQETEKSEITMYLRSDQAPCRKTRAAHRRRPIPPPIWRATALQYQARRTASSDRGPR